MKPTSYLFIVLAALASPAAAQVSSQARAPRPTPIQSSTKVDAAPTDATEALTRPANIDASAQALPPRKPFVENEGRSRATAPVLDRLYYTTQPDGSTWVSGQTYKARFGPGGATYVPFLGSRAPRNFPLALSLESATVDGVEIPLAPAESAVRDGDRIVIDRGPIDEVYELGLDSVEQTFVVGERPPSGDLRFVVHLDTEMSRSEDVGGFTYSNEHGSVHYGRAFVRESDGHRVPMQSRSVDGGVEILVGREYLEHAMFPLVIDPVITTFAVASSTQDTWESDVSYDVSTNRYLTVYEFNFSQSDGEIHAVLRDANVNLSYFALLDNTTDNWRSPQCANLNAANQFLMVGQVSNVLGAPNWNIWGMTVDATSFVSSNKFLISTMEMAGPKYLADVGGDSFDGAGPSYYCVTWRRDYTQTDWDIHARLVTAQGSLVGAQTLLIDNSGLTRDSFPSISKSNGVRGVGASWTIAWHREVTTTNYNIHVAQLSWDGLLLSGPTSITSAPGFEYYPRASSPLDDGRSLVIYGVDFTTDDDINYALLSGTSVIETGSLSVLDSPATLIQDQIEYSIDSDGQRFVVAYAENFQSSTIDYDIWIGSFAVLNNSLMAVESHQSLDFSALQSLRTDLVGNRSGGAVGSTRFYASWDSLTNGQHDVNGGFYDRPQGGRVSAICFGDGSSAACPCSDNGGFQSGCPNSQAAGGAYLAATGQAQTGAGDNLLFQVNNVPVNVTCTLFQGTGMNSGAVFGDGVRCVSGTQIRIRSKPSNASGSAIWPEGAEADVSVTGLVPVAGALRFYQVSYRNSAVFCTPATFNISSGLKVLWLP